MEYIASLILYVGYVVLDGDYGNDWSTHLPTYTYGSITTAGYILSLALGY